MKRLFLLFLVACSSTSPAPGTVPEAGVDAGADVSIDAPAPIDAPADGGHDILGTLQGQCPLVTSQLGSGAYSLHENTLAFASGETYSRSALSPGGQRIFDTPNAGGSSIQSEVMSFEILHHCDGATLLKTEKEITYDGDAGGSISDILVVIDGKKIGVQPTRVYKPGGMNDTEVKAVIDKKLQGIKESTARVSAADRWVKQILHVFAPDAARVDAVKRVLAATDPQLLGDTVVVLTLTSGGGFLYCDPDPPLGSECN
jgi:hypothetical protein